MLKILLKNQLYELNQSFFYDRKKGKARSKGASIAFIALFALLILVVLGGMFIGVSFLLGSALIPAKLGWMYYSLLIGVAVLLGIFGSVFNTFQSLYCAKDNDLLLSLPIDIKYVIISRLLGVYLMGFLYSGIVIIPAGLVYMFIGGFSLKAFFGAVCITVCVSVFVFILSCALGYLVAKITKKLKNKSLITVLASLVFIGIYYFCYFKASSVITKILENAVTIGNNLKNNFYFVYFIGKAAEGDITQALIMILIIALTLVLTYLVIKKSFLKLAFSTANVKRSGKKERISAKISIKKALFKKEFTRFMSSPAYMLNCSMASLFLILGGAALLIKGKAVLTALDGLDEFIGAKTIYFSIVAIICLIASMNNITAPSVSLEGKNIWILRSLPINETDILNAKLKLHIALTSVPLIFFGTSAIIVFKPDALSAVYILAVPQVFMLLSAVFGLYLNCMKPNLDWVNETVAVKQSMCVMFTMLGGWAYDIAVFLPYFFIRKSVSAPVYLGIVTILTAALSLICYKGLKTAGVRKFKAL